MKSNRKKIVNRFLIVFVSFVVLLVIVLLSYPYCINIYVEHSDSVRYKLKERDQYTIVPDGGINETIYVPINGSDQWINIYGEDINNPVLLYLHGGPCGATSYFDWYILRKLSDVYTVVSWDQRGCGHNYNVDLQNQEVIPLTKDVMMQDGNDMTNFLLKYLHKEKITLFGHSWGSIFAANLALEHPERYDTLILASLVVDVKNSRQRCKDYLLDKAKDNKADLKIVESFDPNDLRDDPKDKNDGQLDKLEPVLQKYCVNPEIDKLKYEKDCYLLNPNLSEMECKKLYADHLNIFKTPDYSSIYGSKYKSDNGTGYIDLLIANADEMEQAMSILNKCKYDMPVYLLEGRQDRRPDTMYSTAIDYFNTIVAPKKNLFEFTGGHSSPILQADKLSEYIHKIAQIQN